MKPLTKHFVWLVLGCALLVLAAACETNDAAAPGSGLAPTRQPIILNPTPTLAPPLQIAGTATAVAADGSLPTLTATPPPTDTPAPTATPLPPPDVLLPTVRHNFANGDMETVAVQARGGLEAETLTAPQREEFLYWLGRAELENGSFANALAAWDDYLETAAMPDSAAYFFRAEALRGLDDTAAAAAYTDYLTLNPELGAYIYPRIAQVAESDADKTAALQAATNAPSHYLTEVFNRLALANSGLITYTEQIAQYAAVRDLAQTEFTKGEMTYLIGQTYVLSDDLTSAYTAYQAGVNSYPRAYESYLGLIELVEAGEPVDPFQRGLVDFYAKAYSPATQAFNEYLAANPESARADTYLYLAWSFEGLGDFESAQKALNNYLALNPEDTTTIATYYREQAELLTRSVSTAKAIETLQEFVAKYPDHPEAGWAAWRAALLADRFRGDAATAIDLYGRYLAAYPTDENAVEGRFRLGMLHWAAGNAAEAQAQWLIAAESAESDPFGRAALVWLLDTLPAEDTRLVELRTRAAALPGDDYYSLRAHDVSRNLPAYAPAPQITLALDEPAAQREAEEWLRQQFRLPPDTVVQSKLAAELAADPRLIRGEKLWELGLAAEAKRELEALREAYADNPQLSYQLALYFRDLGLYRSSILAAESVLARANATVFDAPPLIGRLAFPVYFADLVLPLAEQYEYDPLLQFSLMRQESLFESFAASPAAAQGLTQIIPDTGRYIAQQIQWEGYENADLFRPYLNLAFGAYYLDQQLENFDGSVAAALSAYNAGPGNAAGWYATAGDDHDLYLETVNFAETRLYIRNIYRGQAIYRFLYGGDGAPPTAEPEG